MTPFAWTADHLALLAGVEPVTAPKITAADIQRVTADVDVWDHWPVLDVDGATANFDGRALVIALSAPVFDDPNRRHDLARLRLFSVAGDDWTDLGFVLPDGFTPGSREWAGSAVIDEAHERLDLYFTATGLAGETLPSFNQRILGCRARMDGADGRRRPIDWSAPAELIRPDDVHYQSRHEGGGAVGAIKAFRDPFVFIDSQTGLRAMVFTGSSPSTPSAWNGVVGLAIDGNDGWVIRAPLVTALGVNNELERPHIVGHEGRIYLFWSTQAGVFAPGIAGRTGLYGLVSDRLQGPWSPLNGSGLVFANPEAAPAQAYSWQVLDDLSVWSFADQVSLPGRATRPVPFAGAPAPALQLWLDGDRAGLQK
ncbi:hypothetical protein BZG35_16745 [Brevundimonas sp. LM2]|uniref:glycoside hydrolase family 68 protein n=1 Tax=Brevundimonas sp. LM2 TaxID=1938605 RepID=UPI000983AACF|nr:glycoside hydrolase family 68 protein [Brevundimonas sp. LM2]AQR63605.1 hypothetical protein BZG35_16745 [Brevundimonas sp. LM2]